jgi:hypothetical protein
MLVGPGGLNGCRLVDWYVYDRAQKKLVEWFGLDYNRASA